MPNLIGLCHCVRGKMQVSQRFTDKPRTSFISFFVRNLSIQKDTASDSQRKFNIFKLKIQFQHLSLT